MVKPDVLFVAREGEEIISGSLLCAKCSESYPIVDSIPNFLPPELRQ
ncbi:MAG: hypothetical protein IH955_03865 [Chloroflexi bacterium]|nr:hypothetical protein [Chloroflexota bacterium]